MLMTGITNATIIPKDGRISRMTALRSASKPFVVCSMASRRYGEHKTSESPTVRPTLSSGDGPHAPDKAPTKQSHRPGQVRSVVSTTKAEVRRSCTQPAPPPKPGNTRSKKSAASSRLAPKDHALSEKTIGSKPTMVVKRPKEDKTTHSRLAPANSTQLTTANEAPPRPSCLPRGRFPRSLAVASKAAIPRPRNPGIKASTNVLTTRAGTHVVDTGPPVKKPSVNQLRPGVRSTQNAAPALHKLVMHPPVDCLPPDLSSFPSQSWIVASGVDAKEAKSTATVCGNETPDAEKSGSADMADDSCGSRESFVTSPAPSLSSTVVSTPSTCVSGVDDIKVSCQSVEASPADCDAEIISQSRNGATAMERGQANLPTKNLDSGDSAQTTVKSAFEIARNLFSGSQHASQATHGTAALKSIGTDVSRLRSLFIPPLDKDTKASQNAMIQMEIEMLRTQKKVAGGGVVNPRLERLGSLSAIAIAAKHSTPSSARI